MGQPPISLLALTRGLARGDDNSWEHFHHDYGAKIFRQLLALVDGNEDLAKEALQQTYLRIARYVQPCACAPMFARWLRLVAQSALSDCRRGPRRFWQLRQLYQRSLLSDNEIDEKEEKLHDVLGIAMDALGEEQRVLLDAKYYFELSVKEIAEKLSVSEKSIESRLTRARAALRRELLARLKPS